MKLIIKPVANQQLAESIQYFIFCNAAPAEKTSYQTFPNTNLCLSLYRSARIMYNKDINFCRVESCDHCFTSKVWGFHEKAFNVTVDGALDQVCILFHPAGIKNFTNTPYEVLMNADNVFELMFGQQAYYFLEQLFETNDTATRFLLLEQFLLKSLIETKKDMASKWVLQRILQSRGDIRIGVLAGELGINNATLYNKFIHFAGQSPKDFIKTLRFRSALSALKRKASLSLTAISYSSNYYDQAHFIKECQQLTSYTPKEIRHKALIEQEELIWMHNF